jgi:hypothetical protein
MEEERATRKAEEAFLVVSASAKQGGNVPDGERRQMARYHQCSPGCKFEQMATGSSFFQGGRSWRATGDILVCKESLQVHRCGVGYCKEAIKCIDGTVCSVTSYYIQDANYSYDTFGTRYTEVRDDDYEYNEHAQNEEETTVIDVDETTEKIENTTPVTVDITRIYELFIGNTREIEHVLWACPSSDLDTITAKISERCEWRKQAEHAWDVRAHGLEYLKKLESDALEASYAFFKWLLAHIISCFSKGYYINTLFVFFKYLTDVHPYYEGVYYGGDVVALNAANKVYFIECMLNIWEQYASMPAVVACGIRFNDCCTAILSKLQEGFYITVYMVEGDEKPYQSTSLTWKKQMKAREVKIWMIDPHPQLHLVSTDVVRVVQNQLTNKKRAERDTSTVISNCFTGKRICNRKRQPVMNRQRSNMQKSSRIPPLKLLHVIVAIIVEHVKTLDELRSFTFAEITKKAYQQLRVYTPGV